MHIHILGICGTFMGGLAILAREMGFQVSGSDQNVYPPMSNQLEAAGIGIMQGYHQADLQELKPDLVITGNTLSRGNECIEYVLDNRLPVTSGPAWLAENVLGSRCVLAVSGTHGKTTTTSMLAWILDQGGIECGFLIGGVAENFGSSARLGNQDYFVIEADEYDTAFFDKRSKFIHYRPKILVINNMEFDHADIFTGMDDIRKQFHHLLKTVPSNGKVIVRNGDTEINKTLEMGCWTPVEEFGLTEGGWTATDISRDGSAFTVMNRETNAGRIEWGLFGKYNVENALAAVSAAAEAGIRPEVSCEALNRFKSVKRRLQFLEQVNDVSVYDDFAHHPTAIRETLDALRQKIREGRIIAVLEPRSNTMKMGIHKDTLAGSLSGADRVFLYQGPDVKWDLGTVTAGLNEKCTHSDNIDEIIEGISVYVSPGDHVLIMSNGAFENIHHRLIERLKTSQCR